MKLFDTMLIFVFLLLTAVTLLLPEVWEDDPCLRQGKTKYRVCLKQGHSVNQCEKWQKSVEEWCRVGVGVD